MDHDIFLARAIEVAMAARASGNHPFGAILVASDGEVLMEQGNEFSLHQDGTAHAERLLMTRASIAYDKDVLAGSTLYTSAEPCAMCSGSVYWAGVGRVVYGLSEKTLKDHIGPHPARDFGDQELSVDGCPNRPL